MSAKKSGLGRGLGALLGDTGALYGADSGATLLELPTNKLVPNPDQPRKVFDEQELRSLADSVAQNGVLQPIVVRKQGDLYQIVAGERRYQAACRAGMESVPAVVRDIDDKDVLQLALIENLQRADLNPLEAAQGYRDLIDQNGLTQEELGKVLSKSRSAISNALRLLELPDEVQQLVEEGALSAGHARAILAVQGDEERCALARKVVDERLSVRQTEILGPLFSGKSSRVPGKRTPAPKEFKRAAKKLRRGLDAKVSVRTIRGKNKIEIEFESQEQLDALVDRMLS